MGPGTRVFFVPFVSALKWWLSLATWLEMNSRGGRRGAWESHRTDNQPTCSGLARVKGELRSSRSDA